MTDFEDCMRRAWAVVAPMLKANPDELKARLARRRSKMFLRPVRASCLAVRANDRRITPMTAAIVPDHAIDAQSPYHPCRLIEHQVTLNKKTLIDLCRPVSIEPPGEPADIVAKRLGTTPAALHRLRANGTLEVHYVKGLWGRRGRPVPLVYTDP
jgi:hypothetical protein